MQDAAYILESLLETCLYGTGFFYLFFWIAERKPTNREALYIFAALLVAVLVMNFAAPINLLFLWVLLSLKPLFTKKPKPLSVKKRSE